MVRLSTAGVVVYASSDDPAGMARPAWMTTGAAASGAAVTLAYYGLVTEPSWAWSPGPLYVGVGGLLTQTPPASGYIRLVGAAVSATTVWLDPQPAIALA
jgi:hypothetical protein